LGWNKKEENSQVKMMGLKEAELRDV